MQWRGKSGAKVQITQLILRFCTNWLKVPINASWINNKRYFALSILDSYPAPVMSTLLNKSTLVKLSIRGRGFQKS